MAKRKRSKKTAPAEESASDEARESATKLLSSTSKDHNENVQEPAKKKRKRSKKKKAAVLEQEPLSGSGDDNADPLDSKVAVMEQNEEVSVFPYPTEADDHCESPKEAYEHILPFLNNLQAKGVKSYYDPYFCDGAVQKNMEQLGFPDVYNRKEDCYKIWESGTLPAFDALVTNPPYSEDHMEKLMKFVTSPEFGNRPWFLLLPNWVHKKDFFIEATQQISPFYVVPRKRYVYIPPAGFREAKKSDVHKKSSPFVSMWYVWGGTSERNQTLMKAFHKSPADGPCDLARSRSALRDLRRKKR